ncbi:hypothetical protein MCEGKSE7_01459 [Candidatus Nanopelagicaceae bacterium]
MKRQQSLAFLRSTYTKFTWYFLVLGWAVIRTFLVKEIFQKNGVNPFIYLAIDLAASVPYAKYTHKLAISYLDKDWEAFKLALLISVLTFYAPDIYILAAARHVPSSIYFGFFFVLALFSTAAIISVLKRVKPRPH